MLTRVVLVSLFATGALATTGHPLPYPAATRGNVAADYHGVKVPDPYRWMEDIDSPATRAWVEAEGKLSRTYLDAIPGRAAIEERLRKIWNFERWSAPEHHGQHWFYTHNDGLQNQSVIFATADPGTVGKVLLDPNTLSKDGTVALRQTAISDDGGLFAYALSDAGSDWQIWHVRNVDTGAELADEIHWSKAGGGSWRKDGSGFYYTTYDAPRSGAVLKAANQYEKLFFHRLGTPQSQDTLVYTRTDDPGWFVGGNVTDDGRFLVFLANHGDEVQNTLLVQDLSVADPAAPILPIIPKPTAVFTFIGNIGSTLYVQTDEGAPRYKIVAIELSNPDPAHWRTVVPQAADTLDSVTHVKGQLVAQYLHDAHSAVRRYTPEGKLVGEVQLVGLGFVCGFLGWLVVCVFFFTYSCFF